MPVRSHASDLKDEETAGAAASCMALAFDASWLEASLECFCAHPVAGQWLSELRCQHSRLDLWCVCRLSAASSAWVSMEQGQGMHVPGRIRSFLSHQSVEEDAVLVNRLVWAPGVRSGPSTSQNCGGHCEGKVSLNQNQQCHYGQKVASQCAPLST